MYWKKQFILIHLAVLGLSFGISACAWDSSLYKKYVNAENGVTHCLGICLKELDEEACQGDGLVWAHGKCILHETNDDENTCKDKTGTYAEGRCKIRNSNACEKAEGQWKDLDYTTLDLGNGYYVWQDDHGIKCGLYDEIGQGHTETCQNAEYVAALEEALAYKACPVYASVACTEVGTLQNQTEENDDASLPPADGNAQAVGMCSSCDVGKYRCVRNGGSECADLMNDKQHCGSCANACRKDETCVNGVCKVLLACKLPDVSCGYEEDGVSPVCYNGDQYCGAVCENGILIDEGVKCVDHAQCKKNDIKENEDNSNVTYTCQCIDGYFPILEDGKIIQCVNPKTDANYCGSTPDDIAKGNKHYCLDNEHCKEGACVCNENHIRCNNACIHPETSAYFCGARGTCTDEDKESENYRGIICPTGNVCRNNACVCDVANQYVSCHINGETICVHPSDVLYCGAHIPEGKNICDIENFENCSNSQKICQYNSELEKYTCACPQTMLTCDGECVNPMEHVKYCGADTDCKNGDVCKIGEVCQEGKCVTSCPPGQDVCDNKCVSLDTDDDHCGKCDFGCKYANGYAKCYGAVCNFAACQTGYGDCNQDTVQYSYNGETSTSDGCETHLFADPKNCGACGNVCDYVNATTACKEGKCVIDTCKTGYLNCDGNMPNGCEINGTNNTNHCGKCGNKCVLTQANVGCTNSKCVVKSCNSGYGNCDSKDENGCETNITNNANHCGKCGTKCAMTCYPKQSCTSKCESSSCCVTGRVDKKYSKNSVKCCSGHTRYKYTQQQGCNDNTHYACLKSAPSGKCWKKE